jgi:hypothetical protein
MLLRKTLNITVILTHNPHPCDVISGLYHGKSPTLTAFVLPLLVKNAGKVKGRLGNLIGFPDSILPY